MNKVTIYLGIIAFFVLPLYVQAGPIMRTGDSISVDDSQVLNGDFYGFAPTVSLSGPATNDVYIGGGTVTINASVGQDLSVIGGVVQVHGDVNDDVRIVGGEVTLAKLVKGDVVVMGGSLTVLSTAVIEGDILFLGNDLAIEGEVVGSIHGNAQKARINSKVDGDVTLTAQSLFTLGDNAEILGSITYESSNLIVRAQDAQVAGEIRKTDSPLQPNTNSFQFYGMRVFILLFTAFAIFFVARKQVGHVVDHSKRSFGMSGLVGLGAFIIIPFVSGVFMVSILGMAVGVALLALYVLMLIFSFAISGILLGSYIQERFMKREEITFSTVGIGVVALSLVGLVPYLGGISLFALAMIAFGGTCLTLYRQIRS